jgi:fructan beta-fructosidase
MKNPLMFITALIAAASLHATPETNAKPVPVEPPVPMEKILTVDGTHLIVPISNVAKGPGSSMLLGIYDGEKRVQDFVVALPQGDDPYWLAAYPIEPFSRKGKQIKIAPVEANKMPESCRAALEKIRIGAASDALAADDYEKPYRNQFHASTRRGWVNDPNGMVFFGGKYHLYYQYNPFGIAWGNMHWGHLETSDLVHWEEKPIALFQRTTRDMAFSGGGFVDHNNSAGLGKDTLFIAFTSTGRGECLAYSKDGGITFTELPENPVVKHSGRDPKIIWYQPEQKWVMVVFNDQSCDETEATPPQPGSPKKHAHDNMVFYESKNLRQWTRTGAFTDPDRISLYECPEMFELPVAGKPGESRWILLGAQNRYFVGKFDGKTFHKESGPLGTTHGAFYAAQTFSDVPDGRRIQIGWVRTNNYVGQFPDQIVNQAFTLPHEMTLRETKEGLRIFFSPVKELEALRGEVLAEGKNLTPAQANELLQHCAGELSEIWIDFADSSPRQLLINGMDAGFTGRSARIFTDRTFNEIYADDGISYELRNAPTEDFPSKETKFSASEGTVVSSLKIYRLKSIWNTK